jgi:hypothetical protein
MTKRRVAGFARRQLSGLVLTTAAILAAPVVAGPALAQAPALSLGSLDARGDLTQARRYFREPAFATPGLDDTDADADVESTAFGIATSLFDVISESLFGDVYAPGKWRPLSFGTFFSEGWNESWAAPPDGRAGLTPRQGWLGALNGVFYRLWVTTFSESTNLNTAYRGDQYTGLYQIFLPFSRRFELRLDVPFIVSNGTTARGRGYVSQFGDLTIIPRFLLSETAAVTQVFALDIRTPTGSRATADGVMSLAPRYEFWSNPVGAWVVRGGAGFLTPLNRPRGPSGTGTLGDMAVGRYFTPHDVPFGDLVFYAAANWSVPLDGTARTGTLFTVGPGMRFHITRNFFFLHDWQFPVTGPHPEAFTMQFALLKIF